MKSDICLRNGRIVTPDAVIDGGIAIRGETIVGVGPDSELGDAARVIDLEGKIAMPGLFDPHTHFGAGDGAMTDDRMARDFEHESRDSLIGGVTSIATTTLIGGDLIELIERGLHCGRGQSWVDFKLTCVMVQEDQVAQIPALMKSGCVDFKFFTGYAGEQAEKFGMSVNGIPPEFFYRACAEMTGGSTPAFPKIHAEDPYVRGILVDRLREMGRDDELVAWAESSPEWAESLQIYTYGLLARDHNVPMYPVHISSGYSVDTIIELRKRGLNIVAETLPLFLSTTCHELQEKGFSKQAKIQPPVRFQKDRERLWQGIKEGAIQIIGTDSVPHEGQSGFKDGDFWHCSVGVNNQMMDTLPLLFDQGIHGGQIDLQTLARITSTNATKMYGIYPKKGLLAEGSDADIVVVDADREITLGMDRVRGKSDYCLWTGRKAKGTPVMTFLRGQLVSENGEIVAEKASGQFIDS
ncbi:MAG: amidohydrolase family protein [Rhodospirillales bacterium]|jgi:dihydropyrimidinase/dihydroorotase|nr:amidohydrolase family protein [Rhodospirillales bacterium]MDP6646477.1 amidohydrolase family protein [Rhodospirillales bacterium]